MPRFCKEGEYTTEMAKCKKTARMVQAFFNNFKESPKGISND